MDKPLLSICIPTYNRCDIVYQCVMECLAFPYDWIEVVVTDNCSTDKTTEMLRSIHDPRFRYFRNDRNIGYINFSVSLINGSGKFCLLLSDEDVFVDTNWLKLKSQLEKADGISVFQFIYNDENGNALVVPPSKRMEANKYETLKKIYNNFRFAGGVVLKGDIARNNWKNYDNISHLWSLYSETILPLNCVIYGDYSFLDEISVQRSKRNNTGVLDVKAWCGGMNEPYWSSGSRKQQYLDWVAFFGEFGANKSVCIKLAKDVIKDSIYFYSNYYDVIFCHEDEPLFKKYSELIEIERKKYKNHWIKSVYTMYRDVCIEFDNVFGRANRSVINECIHIFICVMIIIKKKLKGLFV